MAKDIRERAERARKLDETAMWKELRAIQTMAQNIIDTGEGY